MTRKRKPTVHTAKYERDRAVSVRQIVSLWLMGFTYAKISEIVGGITRQGVQVIIRPNKMIQRAVHKRAEGRCEHCKKRRKILQIHHRSRSWPINRMSNLEILCKSCHKRTDAGAVRVRNSWDLQNGGQ
jgi:hypothetical protein